jgi:hypothetical protein
MRAQFVPFTFAVLVAALSGALAQDELPVPEEQQVLEALPTTEAATPTPEGTATEESAEEAAAAPDAVINPNPLSGLNLESLSATLSAPLFTPSRTGPVIEEPAVAVAEEPAPPPEVPPEESPPPLQLVGIVMTEAAKTALLKDPGTNEVHRLNSGDEYEGWSVMVVDGRSIEFRSGDRVEGLKMFETFPTPASYGISDLPYDPTLPQEDQLPMEDPAAMEQPPIDDTGRKAYPQLQGGPQASDPQLQGMPPDAVQFEEASPEAPAGPPQNFDPQTGELIIPEEGPLDAGVDPNTPN